MLLVYVCVCVCVCACVCVCVCVYVCVCVCVYLFLVDGNPISGGKPLVIFDIINSILQVPISLSQVDLQQISQ